MEKKEVNEKFHPERGSDSLWKPLELSFFVLYLPVKSLWWGEWDERMGSRAGGERRAGGAVSV